jgi:superfamily II DNA or RNA helicase/phage gp16-like protein
MKELLTLIIQNIENFELSAQFRKGQKPFYDAIIEGLKKGWKTMYIEGPTGMGKTFIEAVVAAAVIGDSNIKVLLLTSKITLLQQIQREFKKFVGFLKTGLFGGGFKNYHEQVTIMTYDSFRNLDETIAKQYSAVLLDEGHKGLGEKTKAKLERQKDFSILIGFTASATYSAKKSLENFLENLAYKLSITEAVELAMLSNIKVMIASVDIEVESQRKGESKGNYEERISSEIIREGGNIATTRLYKRVFAKRNLRGIALVLTSIQGNDLVEQFALEGIKAELIHSGMKRAEREDMFTRFRNHEFSVLIGMGIIKEGFDDPGVSVAITTYPVSSTVDMTQFPGRAERIDETNQNKVAYIVNLAYKAKKQLFYTDILDGKSEVLQKQVRRKNLDIISSDEIQSAIAKKPESYITNVAVSEKEVVEVSRMYQPVEFLSYAELKRAVQVEGVTGRKEYIKAQREYDTWPSHPWITYAEKYSFDDFFGARYLSYVELKKAVQAARIRTSSKYRKVQKNHNTWPSQPWKIYADEYSYEDFFGKKPVEFLSYEELKKAVQAARIRTSSKYRKVQKNHNNWPSKPWRMYSNQYSREDFFGSRYLSYKKLKEAVQAAGITSGTEYTKAQKNHNNWPSNLCTTYADEYSYEDFFGKKPVEFLSYEELKKAVQAEGVNGRKEYIKAQREYDTWPSSPWRTYADEYSYEDFFGLRYFSYEELKKAVQDAGVRSTSEYQKVQREHENWPSEPWKIYADEYAYEDFLGKELVEFLSYEELKKAVQAAGITRYYQYMKVQKKFNNWPSQLSRMYANEYSHEDFFGSRYLSYKDLKKAVQAVNVRTTKEYQKVQQGHENWPSDPRSVYADEYSYEDFYGKQNVKK